MSKAVHGHAITPLKEAHQALGFALLIDPNMSPQQRTAVRQSLVGPLFEVSGGFGLTSVPRNDPRFTNDGKGCGAKGYAWTAADYLELILRDLLGVSYDGFADRLEVKPRILDDFCLRGLDLPRRGRITVRHERGTVRVISE